MREEEIEIWKDIPGYEGIFQASNLGRIKSLARYITRTGPQGNRCLRQERIRKPHPGNHGYISVGLTIDKQGKSHLVHRLVAEVFIPNPDNLPEVNHKDTDKSNNKQDNLEWTTRKGNMEYAANAGRMNPRRGASNKWTKLTEASVVLIKTKLLFIATNADRRAIRKELAERFKVGPAAIYQIDKGNCWKHIYAHI